MGLHPKTDERMVYKFFATNCGKICDVQIVKDPHSGRSKGNGYVEFYEASSVVVTAAVEMHHFLERHFDVSIQPSWHVYKYARRLRPFARRSTRTTSPGLRRGSGASRQASSMGTPLPSGLSSGSLQASGAESRGR